jgi:hypothetical protein
MWFWLMVRWFMPAKKKTLIYFGLLGGPGPGFFGVVVRVTLTAQRPDSLASAQVFRIPAFRGSDALGRSGGATGIAEVEFQS